MAHKYQIIKISKLIVNPENYRFNPVNNEIDAMKTMLDKHDKEIQKLLIDILINGLNPSDPLIVTEIDKKYLTLEGNRRLTALKIIDNIDILKEVDSKYYDKYKKIIEKNNKITQDDLSKIPCVNFDSAIEADKWVELKHTGSNGGKGTIPWGTLEKRRYKDKASEGKSSALVINQIIDYINQSPYYVDSIKSNIQSIRVTNLERLLSDPLVRDVIGIDIKKGVIYKLYPDSEIAKPFTKILDDLISQRISVTDIYTKDSRTEYTSTFKAENTINPSTKLDNSILLSENVDADKNNSPVSPNTPQQLTMLSNLVPLEKKADANLNINPNVNTDTVHENISLNTDNNLNKPINEISADINNRNINNNTPNNNTTNNIANNKSQKDNRDINDRKNLIPGRVQIKINNPRINQVYKELKKIDINQLPNAVAVLFRVFIEISMDEYIEINTLNNVTQNSKLNNKVQECLNDLKTKKLIKQEFIKPVNVSISDKDSIMSINTFNSYVHNKHMFPDSTQLKNSWNQLEGFLIAIHKNC